MRKREWIVVLTALAALAMGCSGSDGARGPAGKDGSAGPEGDRGKSGLPGPQGAPGDKGPQGPSGEPGDTAEALYPWIASYGPKTISANTILTLRGENFARNGTEVWIGDRQARVLSVTPTEIRVRMDARVECEDSDDCTRSLRVVSRGLSGNTVAVSVVPRGYFEGRKSASVALDEAIVDSVLLVDEDGNETILVATQSDDSYEPNRILQVDPKRRSMRVGGEWTGSLLAVSEDGKLFGLRPAPKGEAIFAEIDLSGSPVSTEAIPLGEPLDTVRAFAVDEEGRIFVRTVDKLLRFHDGARDEVASVPAGVGLAVGDGFVYWTTGGNLLRSAVDVLSVETVAALQIGRIAYREGLIYGLYSNPAFDYADLEILSVDVETGDVRYVAELDGYDVPEWTWRTPVAVFPREDGSFLLTSGRYVIEAIGDEVEILTAPIGGFAHSVGERFYVGSEDDTQLFMEISDEEVRTLANGFTSVAVESDGAGGLFVLGAPANSGMGVMALEIRHFDLASGQQKVILSASGNSLPMGMAVDVEGKRIYVRTVEGLAGATPHFSIGWIGFGGGSVTNLYQDGSLLELSLGMALHEGRLYYPVASETGMGIQVSPVDDFADSTCVACGLLGAVFSVDVAPDGAIIAMDFANGLFDLSGESALVYDAFGGSSTEDGRLVTTMDGRLYLIYR